MKIFTKAIPVYLFALVLTLCFQSVNAQSVLNPADTVYTYNSAAAAGTVTNPNKPANGVVAKWVRTVRMSWNTSEWKCYIYNGVCFRLHFPLGYNPTANDGKVYPLLVFWHGAGEAGLITDNEISMAHGGQSPFQSASDAGTWPGYILIPQNTNGAWDPTAITSMKLLMDYMVTNNKLDPFHIVSNGLSAGGGASWGFIFQYPQVVSADLPMSADDQTNASAANLNLTKFTPLWTTQGGLDTWPDPTDAGIVNSKEIAAGANWTYTFYPTLGHDTWDNCWAEPNFWPFMNAAYSSNPWPLHGQTAFCPGTTVLDTLGVAPGFDAYQWRMNGTVISGATSNSTIIHALGTYDCRVQRNGIWSSWSPRPVVISVRQPTVTPPITLSGVESFVIPALNQTNVTLQVPAGYASYTWQKVGSSTTISSANTLNVTAAGQYIVEVTQTGGCSSSFSAPFTVVAAPGSNAPDPASGVTAAALSQTSVLLNWSQNPSPVHNEVNFEIYQGTKSGGPYQLVAVTRPDASKDTVVGLASATKYYYVIRAVDSTGASTTSNEASVSTIADVAPPTAPGALAVTGSTYNSISLGWAASTDNVGVVGYDIYINGSKAYTVAPTATSFTVYSLANGQNYTFTIKARDAAGNVSSPSNQVSGEALLNGIPYNYYNGIATSVSVLPNYSTMTPAFSGSLPNISLSPQIDNTGFGFLYQGFINIPVTGKYTFQIGSDDGSAMWLGNLNGTASPYVFGSTPTINNNALQGTTYKNSSAMTLQAGIYPIAIAYFQQGGGYAMYFNWQTPGTTSFVAVPNSAFQQSPVVYGTAPAYPTAVTATTVSYKSIGLTWADNSNNETGFEIYRSTTVNGTYNIVTTVGANKTSYTDSSCQASTTYYYKIQAINQYGGSGYDPAQVSGLTYWYYNTGSWSNMALLNSTTPASTGYLTNFSLAPATSANNFAFKYLGYINIKQAGTYTFYTASDDGSDLYVNGYDSAHLVVQNDFLQGTTTRSGTITLGVGRYPLYVTYFQQGGGTALTVSYKGPGIVNQTTIPDSVFYAASSTGKATTAALPAAPTLPTNLAVTAINASSINVSWQDTATNVTTFQLFRSSNGDQNFVQLATLPAATFSYRDTSLFANAKYYYKIEATNVGGSSPFTAEGSATTLDLAPVMNKITNQQVRYGTATVIPVSATVSGGGTVTLTASALPAFASFTDNGNATGKITLNPAKTDSGTYNGLTVTATDAFGGTSSTSFNLWVNNNYAPTLNAITNYSMNEGDSLTISLTGQDVNTADTLTYTVTNLPANYGSTYQLSQNVSGTASLVVKPGYAASGTYNVVVTLNDKNGLSASQSFTLTVADKNPNQTIYARIQANSALGAPWNNMTSPSIAALKDANGVTTAVGVNLGTTYWDPQPLGPSTGNNSGVYPDAVLNQFWYFGLYGAPTNPVMTISGLNPSLKYNITLFGASNFTGVSNNGTTTYASGSQSVSLYVQGNTQNTVTLDTLTPTAGGTINVAMGRLGTTYPGYLNALVIASTLSDGTSPAPPNTLVATAVPSGVGLTWNDVAYNASSYKLYRAPLNTTSFTLLATLSSTATSYTDTTTSGNSLYYYTIDATNSAGASPFSDTAAITTADKVPQIAAIANVTVNNTQSVQVNVTANDDPSDHLTLTASGLPTFASFVDNGNGTGVISISPTAGLQGSYNGATITATDLSDSSRSTSFNINVVDTSISYTYVAFSANPGANPAPWNSLLIPYTPSAGYFVSNLVNQAGANTGITVTLTDGWDGLSTGGEKRRNGSDLYPESVSNYAMFTANTNNHRITVSGLNTAKAYNFQFYSSYFTSQSTLAHITINGSTIDMNGSHNSNKTVQINGIVPDATGKVVITIAKDASAFAAVLNSLVIESYTPGNAVPFSPGDLRKLDYTKTGTIGLQWQDRAAIETGYEVWRAPDGGSYSLLATLPANSTSYTDSSLPASTTYDYVVRTLNGINHSAFSNPVKGYTYDNTVFLFLNRTWPANQPYALAPTPFNNLNWNYPSFPTVWNNFLDENSLPTNIGLSQPDAFDEVDGGGASTGNNSGVFPDACLKQGWLNFPGDSSYLILTGLDVAKSYDITMLGSATDDNTANASAKYAISGGNGVQRGILNGHQNTNGTLTFFNVMPDQGGNISIGLKSYDSANATFAVLSDLVIKGYTPSVNSISEPPVGTEDAVAGVTATAATFTLPNQDSVAGKQLVAYPNPFDQTFNLSVPAVEGDNILVSVIDVAGRILYEKRFENLYQGNNLFQIQPNGSLPKGFYFVSVLYINKNERQLIKLIKK